MGKSSTRAKNKYNRKTYKQINLRMKEELAERFRVACGEKSFAVTLERLLDAADTGKYEELSGRLAKTEKELFEVVGKYNFLCGEMKRMMADEKKLRKDLAEERAKGIFQIVRERIFW